VNLLRKDPSGGGIAIGVTTSIILMDKTSEIPEECK